MSISSDFLLRQPSAAFVAYFSCVHCVCYVLICVHFVLCFGWKLSLIYYWFITYLLSTQVTAVKFKACRLIFRDGKKLTFLEKVFRFKILKVFTRARAGRLLPENDVCPSICLSVWCDVDRL